MLVDTLSSTICELESRLTAGLHVRLLWDRDARVATVAVADRRSGVRFALDVRSEDRPMDVFQHPFAYAAWWRRDRHRTACRTRGLTRVVRDVSFRSGALDHPGDGRSHAPDGSVRARPAARGGHGAHVGRSDSSCRPAGP